MSISSFSFFDYEGHAFLGQFTKVYLMLYICHSIYNFARLLVPFSSLCGRDIGIRCLYQAHMDNMMHSYYHVNLMFTFFKLELLWSFCTETILLKKFFKFYMYSYCIKRYFSQASLFPPLLSSCLQVPWGLWVMKAREKKRLVAYSTFLSLDFI